MKVGVHQGSILSPLLFVIVIDEITKHLRTDLREFLYADDRVQLGEVGKKFLGNLLSGRRLWNPKG